jgi:hypothetical protein
MQPGPPPIALTRVAAVGFHDPDCNREEWTENRLDEPGEIFPVAVGDFSVMDYHPDGLSHSMTRS